MSEHAIEPAAALIQPGMTMRYSVSLGQDHVVQFETFFDRDSEPEMRRALDVCYREGNRLLGRNQLPILRRQLKDKEDRLQDNLVRKAEVEAKLKTLKELRRDKTLELSTHYDRTLKDAQNEWAAAGKRGEFKPQGHIAGTLQRLKQQIDELASGQSRDDGDGAQQLGVLDGEIKECRRAAAQLQTLIDEAEAMLRGEDVSGVVEE